jgi:hypothetical protein
MSVSLVAIGWLLVTIGATFFFSSYRERKTFFGFLLRLKKKIPSKLQKNPSSFFIGYN